MEDDNHVLRIPDTGSFYSGEMPPTLLHIKPDAVIQAGNGTVTDPYQGQPPSEWLIIPDQPAINPMTGAPLVPVHDVTPLTVRWLGRVTYTEMLAPRADVMVVEPYMPVEGEDTRRIDRPIANITADPTAEIGLRSDGVVVWRRVAAPTDSQ